MKQHKKINIETIDELNKLNLNKTSKHGYLLQIDFEILVEQIDATKSKDKRLT